MVVVNLDIHIATVRDGGWGAGRVCLILLPVLVSTAFHWEKSQ